MFAWQDPAAVERLTGVSLAFLHENAAAIKALDARIARLEQRPVPVPVDTSGLMGRIDALDKRVAAQPRVDLAPLTARLDALEKKAQERPAAPPAAVADTGPLLARLDALEKRLAAQPRAAGDSGTPAPGAASGAAVDLGPLMARLDTLEKRAADPAKLDAVAARVETLAARDPAEPLRARLDGVERQLAGLSEKGASLAEASKRLARLDAVALALANGQKLGPIPDAPPALAKFANAAPPTEAGLRLAFPAVLQAALTVSLPDTEGKPFFERALARIQDFRFITVREGDHVLVGNATAEILAKAQTLLTAGDLTGTIRAVASVSGPPADKLARWLSDAKALEAARAALTAMASNG